MLTIIDKENTDKIKGDFLKKEEVKSELLNNPYGKYLILTEEDATIGYIYYSDIYERAEINQFEIQNIHRNCGKGQILLKYFLKVVEKDITLEAKITNFPAIHIYEKYGFHKVAIRKGYYNGIDGILMERKKVTTEEW